jgi:translocation protein SEC66
MVNWLALLLPFVYLGVLVGGLAVFSNLYRKRKACTYQPPLSPYSTVWLTNLRAIAKAASLAPWFGPHVQRNIYLSLLHIEPDANTPKIPESILKAALLRRATEDIHRIIAIRGAKSSLTALLQRGSVGDDLWQRFLRAEKEIEEELRDVVNEVIHLQAHLSHPDQLANSLFHQANAFSPNWGQTIFQSANEIASNQLIRKRMEELQATQESEREWWDRKKATIQSDFMKELDEDPAKAAKSTPAGSRASDDDAVLVEAGGPADKSGAAGSKKKKGKKWWERMDRGEGRWNLLSAHSPFEACSFV